MPSVKGVNGETLPVYYGDRAVQEVQRLEKRPLSKLEQRVVAEEGYVPGVYLDTKGIPTSGVGQTGKYTKMSFGESLRAHEEITRKMVPGYDNLPDYLRAELLQSTYRGDLGLSPKARRLFNEGRYQEAADEFLDNAEYKNPDTPQQIKNRIKSVSDAMRRYSDEYSAWRAE